MYKHILKKGLTIKTGGMGFPQKEGLGEAKMRRGSLPPSFLTTFYNSLLFNLFPF
jgi:hypothetical protein